MIPRVFAVVPFIVTATAANAQFTGDYAGDTWTIQAPVGGSAAFAADGSSMTLIGPDESLFGSADLTHVVITGGIWSFTWTYVSFNTTSFVDFAYYLINDMPVFLADTGYGLSVNGRESVEVKQGDIIGWRVQSVDGIIGPGMLTITNFSAPVPNPATIGFLGILAVTRARRRR